MIELSHTKTPTSKRFVSISYFEAFDKIIGGITNLFQQPDFRFHKNIQDVFLVFFKLCNQNKYDKLINFSDWHGPDWFQIDLKAQLVQFFIIVDSKDVSIGKLIKILSDFGNIMAWNF